MGVVGSALPRMFAWEERSDNGVYLLWGTSTPFPQNPTLWAAWMGRGELLEPMLARGLGPGSRKQRARIGAMCTLWKSSSKKDWYD